MDRLIQFILSNAFAAMALAFLAAGASRIIKRPPVTRALWILVLLKLLTPPIWNVPISLPTASTPSLAESTISSEPVLSEPVAEYTITDVPANPDLDFTAPTDPEPILASPEPLAYSQPPAPAEFPWPTVVLILWLTGALTVSALILRSTLRLRRIINQSVPAPLAIRRRAAHLARTMGLPASPQILLARGPLPPMLCATGFRPRIILPASLWSKLDDAQQDTVLVHELAHLRHGDHWVRRLELLTAVLYWWHPAVWWSRPHLRESSEQCCDAWVVWTLPRLARSYAQALVETVDFISLSRPALPVLASGMGQFTDLKRRLVMINQASAPRSLSRTGYTAVCSLAGLLLPLAPSFAQEAIPEKPLPPTPPVEVRPPTPFESAPVAPKPAPAPKANILVAPAPFAYSEDEQEASPKPRTDQNRAEVERARAQVEKLRAQLRDAERHLNDVQRNASRDQSEQTRDKARGEAEKERTKAMAEAQKERAKAMAEAQKERSKAQAEAQKERAIAAADRARAAADRDRAMQDRKRAQDEDQNRIDGVNPKPRIDSNFQYRAEPPRTEEFQRAGARIKAAGGQGNQADLERRLDQLERQLDQLVGQLQQMKQQVARPTPARRAEPQKQ